MFTGIITEVGRVKHIGRKGLLTRLDILCEKTGAGLAAGDSVAVNGVCLSIVPSARSFSGKGLSFDVVRNTFDTTNLKRLKPGDKINLEKALKLGDTLSGHMVSGHVDGERAVRNNREMPEGRVLDIGIFDSDRKYLVPKGSVAIDGVSLTVAEIYPDSIRIYVIPHTLRNTILESRKPGDHVNVEFDILAKYAGKKNGAAGITMDMLRAKGFAPFP